MLACSGSCSLLSKASCKSVRDLQWCAGQGACCAGDLMFCHNDVNTGLDIKASNASRLMSFFHYDAGMMSGGQHMDSLNMVPSMWNNSTATGQRQFSQRSDVSDCESPSSGSPSFKLHPLTFLRAVIL